MDAEEGHEIVMGLASAERGYRSGRGIKGGLDTGGIDQGFLSGGQNQTAIGEVPGIRGAHQLMVMNGDLRYGQGDGFGASGLTYVCAIPLMDGDATPEIRKGKAHMAIASEGGPDDLEKGFIIGNGEQLSLTEHPADRCEIAGEHLNFSYVRC